MSALQLMKRAHWDEEQEVWVLQRLSDAAKQRGGAPKRPVSAAGARRPVSAYAKVGVLGSQAHVQGVDPDQQSCMTVRTYAQGSGTLHARRLCGWSNVTCTAAFSSVHMPRRGGLQMPGPREGGQSSLCRRCSPVSFSAKVGEPRCLCGSWESDFAMRQPGSCCSRGILPGEHPWQDWSCAARAII